MLDTYKEPYIMKAIHLAAALAAGSLPQGGSCGGGTADAFHSAIAFHVFAPAADGSFFCVV